MSAWSKPAAWGSPPWEKPVGLGRLLKRGGGDHRLGQRCQVPADHWVSSFLCICHHFPVYLECQKPTSALSWHLHRFGGAFTDAAGINIAHLSSEAQESLIRAYYSDQGGIKWSKHPETKFVEVLLKKEIVLSFSRKRVWTGKGEYRWLWLLWPTIYLLRHWGDDSKSMFCLQQFGCISKSERMFEKAQNRRLSI